MDEDHTTEQRIVDIGRSLEMSDIKIDAGAYGVIRIGTDENAKKYAVKCIPTTQIGIPYILEPILMMTINHPNINRARYIFTSDDCTYIVQDKADNNIATYTRTTKKMPVISELTSWCHDLAQATKCLHHENIVHCDIKGSNALMFDNYKTVKLCDFGLATKQYAGKLNNRKVCTVTHRPFEVLAHLPWDKSLDIWSLGCTFYEIAFGVSLFSAQSSYEQEKDKNSRDAKARTTQRAINAILDWAEFNPFDKTNDNSLGERKAALKYNRPEIVPELRTKKYKVFADLLYRMLRFDAKDRLTIDQVLAHRFFYGCEDRSYSIMLRSSVDFTSLQRVKIKTYIGRMTGDTQIGDLALEIYSQCRDLSFETEQKIVAACCLIAAKILDLPCDKFILGPDILELERIVCQNICFRIITP